MKLSLLFTILLALPTIHSDTIDPAKKIIGTWKGEADDGKVVLVEFTKYGDYTLHVDGQLLTSGDEEVGQIKYQIKPAQDKNHFSVLLYDAKTKDEYSTLSAIFTQKNQQLTLILFWQDRAVDQVELTRFSIGS